MTYKEQADAVILEMERADWERIGEVFVYAISEAMHGHDYTMASKIEALVKDMNAPRSVYRMFTEWGI